MQPLVLHPPSLTNTQFGQPRFNSGPERLPLNRPWSTNARGCSPRAPLPRQSMSGSPHDEPAVTSGDSNPRGYPPASSPPVTVEEAVAPLAGPPQQQQHQHQHQHQHQLPPTVTDPLPAPLLPRYGEQHAIYASSPRLPPGPPSYPLAALDPGVSSSTNRSLVHKSTRRTKAHVASACVNCKKKHLGCDPARPCRRCVLAGKAVSICVFPMNSLIRFVSSAALSPKNLELTNVISKSSCVDVTHKKRGRPPLKAEDSSMRSYTTHADHPTVPAESQSTIAPSHRALHRPTSSRELRPMTDLHAINSPSSTASRAPRGQQQRWSASVFPLTRPMDPTAAMANPAARRPFSSSGPPSYAPATHPPPSYVPMTSGFNPVIKAGAVPPGMDRRFAPYGPPALPPPTSPPQYSHPAGTPYLPYAESPGNSIHHTMVDPRIQAAVPPREPYLESPVRLPPIHQATASPGPPAPPPGPPGPPPPSVAHHAHRLSDPYPATWTLSREDPLRDPRGQVPPRPMSSVFTHSPHHQRSSSSTTGPLDPVPRHMGPIDLPSPVQLGHSPPLTRTAVPKPEAEPTSEPERPIKRRKMALDDMVNG